MLAACGGAGGEPAAVADAPADPEAPATGTLSVFAYQDTVTDALLDPFREANPDLEVRTATFGSNQEAATKLAGGFEADVVEVCLDEMSPLTARNLLRPLDESGIADWDELVFRDSPGVVEDGDIMMVPLSAGPQGLIYDAAAVEPGEVDSFADLFDPQFADRVALEADYPLPAIAETALALGIEEPMELSSDQLEQVKQHLISNREQFRALWRSDADVVNLFRSGEIVLADGGPGLAQRVRDTGVDAALGGARGAAAFVGLRAGDHQRGRERRRRLPVDQLAGVRGGAGDPRGGRLRGHEPAGDRARRGQGSAHRRPGLDRERDRRDRAAELRRVGAGVPGVPGTVRGRIR